MDGRVKQTQDFEPEDKCLSCMGPNPEFMCSCDLTFDSETLTVMYDFFCGLVLMLCCGPGVQLGDAPVGGVRPLMYVPVCDGGEYT